MVSGILAVLVVTLSLGSYGITQVNAQSGQQQEEESQKAMQKADCEQQLKDKMATDKDAADQYQKKDCADLLK